MIITYLKLTNKPLPWIIYLMTSYLCSATANAFLFCSLTLVSRRDCMPSTVPTVDKCFKQPPAEELILLTPYVYIWSGPPQHLHFANNYYALLSPKIHINYFIASADSTGNEITVSRFFCNIEGELFLPLPIVNCFGFSRDIVMKNQNGLKSGTWRVFQRKNMQKFYNLHAALW